MTKDELIALADRVEAGTVDQQRELLDAAYKALFPEPHRGRHPLSQADWQEWANGYNRFFDMSKAGASLDAARTLGRCGDMWAVSDMEDGPFARVVPGMADGTYINAPEVWAEAATPALALTADFIRAHATTLGD